MATKTAVHRTGYMILIFVLLLAVPVFVRAGTSPAQIGTIKEIRGGKVERQDRDVWNPLVVNAEVRANDRIRTGTGATAVLILNDVGLVMIAPGSEYYLGDPSRGFKSLLKRGYLWVSTRLKPGSAMSIATASAVAGVRGTKFSVIQDANGMNVCTCKGEVQVTLKDGKSMNITSGMYGEVDTSGKMSAPANGRPHLDRILKERPARYTPCLDCHRKGKKTADPS